MNSCAGFKKNFIKTVKTISKLEIERAAIHEAGHAVASVHLAVPFDYVEIYSNGTGQVHLPETPDIALPQVKDLAQNQIIVAYAGSAAQRLFYPDQQEYEIMQCSNDDMQKIKNIAADFSDVEIGCKAKDRARIIVEELRDAVDEAAQMLRKKWKLTSEEVRKIYMTRRN
jgi:ATP-dependent Zn protease